MTVPELLAALTLTALSLGTSVPALYEAHRSAKLTAAARELSAEMYGVRMRAIATGLHAGLLIESSPAAGQWRPYVDGGRAGIHSSEIRSGVDVPVGRTIELRSRYPGIRLGIPSSGSIPRIPPRAGLLDPGEDPVALGRSDIYSASPTGGTSSGTIYLTDGTNLRAIVAYGPTGRIRLWRYDVQVRAWKLD